MKKIGLPLKLNAVIIQNDVKKYVRNNTKLLVKEVSIDSGPLKFVGPNIFEITGEITIKSRTDSVLYTRKFKTVYDSVRGMIVSNSFAFKSEE